MIEQYENEKNSLNSKIRDIRNKKASADIKNFELGIKINNLQKKYDTICNTNQTQTDQIKRLNIENNNLKSN